MNYKEVGVVVLSSWKGAAVESDGRNEEEGVPLETSLGVVCLDNVEKGEVVYQKMGVACDAQERGLLMDGVLHYLHYIVHLRLWGVCYHC